MHPIRNTLLGLMALFALTPDLRCQPASSYNVKQYGATGRRADNATKPIQDAIDAATAAGGGMVYVPPGEYTVGAIHLKDNVNLHLEAGATFLLSQNRADFAGARSMINSAGAKNIGVTGRGTLNGLAQYEYVDVRGADPEIAGEQEIARKAGIEMKRYYRTGMQTYMFILNDSTDVRLEDITVINSPLWNVRLNDCDRVFIRGVRIYSDLEKGVNSDGIDIVSTSNVLISDSIVITADDAIVIKTEGRGGRPARVSENITVTNCLLGSSSGAMKIGTETLGDIRHVIFSNSVIRDTNKALGIDVHDGAVVSDIVFSNITIDTRRRHWNWWGSAEMFKFTLKKRRADSKVGVIKDVLIDNVIARARGTSTITGLAERPLENITISNVHMYMDPEDAVDKRATDAIQAEHVNGLKIRNVTVQWSDDKTEEKWRSAMYLRNVNDLDMDGFTGRQGLKSGKAAAIVLESVTDGLLRNLRAVAGSGAFLEVRGAGTKDIVVYGSDLRKAGQAAVFTNGAVRTQVTLRQ